MTRATTERRPATPLFRGARMWCTAHSNCSACCLFWNPQTVAAIVQGWCCRVRRAPPLMTPLCCRSRRVKLLVMPTYVDGDGDEPFNT